MSLVRRYDKLSRPQQGKTAVRQFQCTYKRCGAIITRLGQHMTRVHKITNDRELTNAKARCIRLPFRTKAAAPPPTKKPKAKVAKREKKQKHRHASTDTSGSSADESYVPSGSTSDENEKADDHQLKVDADIDNMSSFAESDAEDEPNI